VFRLGAAALAAAADGHDKRHKKHFEEHASKSTKLTINKTGEETTGEERQSYLDEGDQRLYSDIALKKRRNLRKRWDIIRYIKCLWRCLMDGGGTNGELKKVWIMSDICMT